MMLDRQPLLENAYADPDCGCPVEEWIVNYLNITIHFEDDGTMELYADAGDWDLNLPLKAKTMDGARSEAFAWVAALPLVDG